ncbi:MAG: hypothetical protein EPO65_13670 [Dehalococcoidia bacterium]|nr:MAG: hypothetical protein EPO65_13670 [Dehalococcoidia bacterium]
MGFRKVAGLAGIGFVVLLVGSFLMYGSPPSTAAKPDEIAKYVADTDSFLLGGLAGILGAALMIPWVAGFVIPFAESDRARGEGFALMIAGSTLVACAAIGTALALLATLGLRTEELDGPTVRVLWDASNVAYSFSILLVVPAAGATALAVLKHGLMPRWFGYLSGVAALLGLSAIPGFVATGDAAMLLLFGFVGMLVWVLASSVLMVRGGAVAK